MKHYLKSNLGATYLYVALLLSCVGLLLFVLAMSSRSVVKNFFEREEMVKHLIEIPFKLYSVVIYQHLTTNQKRQL